MTAAKKAAPAAKKRPAARKTAAPKAKAAAKKTAARKTPARINAPAKPKAEAKPRTTVRAPRTLDEFMALAVTMEIEAAERYAEFADAMEMCNNLEVAALFRKMADIEGKHSSQLMAEMGWHQPPALPAGRPTWDGFEAPETAPIDEVHYLMQPYHALQLALANEERAERFFGRLARAATVATVKQAARELEAEEREHVELVRAWMKKVPKPDPDWADDPDPARYTD
jgi:rubrerythrin